MRTIQQGASEILPEDAPVAGFRAICVEIHQIGVDQEVACYSLSEVAVPVGSYSYDTLQVAAVTPKFSFFIKEVDAVVGHRRVFEGISDQWQGF